MVISRHPSISRHAEAPRKIYKPIHTVDDLALHLRWAMAVELSTIPPYLCALYSIEDVSSSAYRLIRSVVLEEMLHMMLVANLLNAIGVPPELDSDVIPSYPGFMKHHAAGGPFIQLQPLSAELARSVFMAIEQPEVSPHAPPEGDNFETIGQFYKAIELGFEYCVKHQGEQAVFGKDTGFQRDDTYFGSGAGELFTVHDLPSALRAIQEITQQGEGSSVPQPPMPGEEQYGGYDYYGDRQDGTYGPILGVPWELSHYRKFQQIADGVVALPDIYPMQANPSSDQYEGQTRALAELFDASYSLVLWSLQTTFRTPPKSTSFLSLAFPLMRSVLPTLATLLMQTPLEPAADPALGPTAGPGFAYRPTPLSEVVRDAEELLANPPDLGKAYLQLWRRDLGIVTEALRGVREAASQQGETTV